MIHPFYQKYYNIKSRARQGVNREKSRDFAKITEVFEIENSFQSLYRSGRRTKKKMSIQTQRKMVKLSIPNWGDSVSRISESRRWPSAQEELKLSERNRKIMQMKIDVIALDELLTAFTENG